MQTIDDEPVAAEFALEPLGDAGDGGGAQARFLLYLRIGDIVGQQFRRLETLCELGDLFCGEKITQETLCFIRALERQHSFDKSLIFGSFPVHVGTLAKCSALVKWSNPRCAYSIE